MIKLSATTWETRHERRTRCAWVQILVNEATMATPSPSPHKPRRKGKKNGDVSPTKSVRPRFETLVRAPSFPLASFMWPARASSSQWELLPLILMVAGLFRWAAGLWGYSGESQWQSCSSFRKANVARLQQTAHVWRLRGPAPLDGDHDTFADFTMVFP